MVDFHHPANMTTFQQGISSTRSSVVVSWSRSMNHESWILSLSSSFSPTLSICVLVFFRSICTNIPFNLYKFASDLFLWGQFAVFWSSLSTSPWIRWRIAQSGDRQTPFPCHFVDSSHSSKSRTCKRELSLLAGSLPLSLSLSRRRRRRRRRPCIPSFLLSRYGFCWADEIRHFGIVSASDSILSLIWTCTTKHAISQDSFLIFQLHEKPFGHLCASIFSQFLL